MKRHRKKSWPCCGRARTCNCKAEQCGQRSGRVERTTGRSCWRVMSSIPWTMAAKQDDDQRKSIVQQIMQKSTDFLRRIIVLVEGQGGVTLSYVCLHCHRVPLEDYIWWFSMGHGDSRKKGKKQCSRWCAACGGQCNWRNPNRVFGHTGPCGSQRREGVSGACPATQSRARNKCVCSQVAGDLAGRAEIASWTTIFEGLQEQSRLTVTNELGRFIEVDSNEAVKIGVEKHSEAITVARHKFDTESFPNAVIREGVNELTFREGEEGMQRSIINTAQRGGRQMVTTTCGRRLARCLSSHLQGRRGSGTGELVVQARGVQQGSQRS